MVDDSESARSRAHGVVTIARSHAAVLLAAGGSTRLGQPKQLLARDGEPLVRRTARLLLATAPNALFVVLGAHRQAVAQALEGIAHRAVVNEDWAAGLATSLRAAAIALDTVAAGRIGSGAGGVDRTDRVLIALCDQPGLEGTYLDRLLSAASPCAATNHEGRAGVPAVVDRALWAQAASLRGDRGLASLLAARGDVARFDFPALAVDLDTPADLAAARSAGWID